MALKHLVSKQSFHCCSGHKLTKSFFKTRDLKRKILTFAWVADMSKSKIFDLI